MLKVIVISIIRKEKPMANEKQSQTKEKKYNLKNDVIFQTFFSRKGNEEYLIDFLNALLKKGIKTIEVREEVNLENKI